MTKSLTEIFATLQGEGYHAGTPAVFVRFAGCNLWSGREADRARDAERHGAACPRFCDTDFAPRLRLGLPALADAVREAARELSIVPLVVFTGGEPLLQLDEATCDAVAAALTRGGVTPRLAVETNGTLAAPPALRSRLWVCVSPKVPPERIAQREGDELKVVYPGYDPERYRATLGAFDHYFVQAEARPEPGPPGRSLLDRQAMQAAAAYCLRHPRWRLSVQTHKVADIP